MLLARLRGSAQRLVVGQLGELLAYRIRQPARFEFDVDPRLRADHAVVDGHAAVGVPVQAVVEPFARVGQVPGDEVAADPVRRPVRGDRARSVADQCVAAR